MEERGADLERLLRLVPYFRDLDRVSLARLAGALEELHLPEGAIVIREAASAGELYLLERGQVTATVRTADGETEVGTVTAPGSFGEMGLLLSRRTASVLSCLICSRSLACIALQDHIVRAVRQSAVVTSNSN